jgi:hypothetical protein
MADYKMAAVKVTPPNDFPLGLIWSHMVIIHLFLMLCDLQRVVRDLCPTLYILPIYIPVYLHLDTLRTQFPNIFKINLHYFYFHTVRVE